METAQINDRKRILYLDYIKVFASLAVMLIHVTADGWYTSGINSSDWRFYNTVDGLIRWCVPVFVMASGVLFLNKNIPIKKLYTKYILKLLITFVVWSLFYALTSYKTITGLFYNFLYGPYHFWYIQMTIGLYICLPLFVPIISSDNRIIYFLSLSFIFAFFLPWTSSIVSHFGGNVLNSAYTAIIQSLNNLDIHIVLGYSGYFILGFYLNKISLNKKQRIIIYSISLLGALMTIGLSYAACVKLNTLVEDYFQYLRVNVLLTAMGIFVWFKYRNYNNQKLNNFFIKISKYSLAAYIVHIFILDTIKKYKVTSNIQIPVLYVICTWGILFIVSYLISAIINHIPVLKKYIS